MKYFKIAAIILTIFMAQSQVLGFVYLWQADTEIGATCCLHIGGADLCNPNMGCTRHAPRDLAGILDYVIRLLNIEKFSVEPHHTILVQVKQYIRAALNNPYFSIEYRLSEHRSVRFYHEILEAVCKQKDTKSTIKPKSKHDEFVKAYLSKLGLLRKAK